VTYKNILYDKQKVNTYVSYNRRSKLMKKEYEAPKVITYSEDQIIELLGPAQTCSPSPVTGDDNCPGYAP
jgi:hypothetical protein